MIGQLVDEGGLSRSEEDETVSSSSDTSRPTDPVNVLCYCRRRSVLKKKRDHESLLVQNKQLVKPDGCSTSTVLKY